MSRTALSVEEILTNVRALEPLIRERSDDIEQQRRLPDDVFEAVVASGAIRMAVPKSLGGPEMSPLEQIEVIESLSYADPSVAWVVSILSDSGFYAAYLGDEIGGKLLVDIDAGAAGMLAPIGRAEIVEGGYRVNGHWAFGSGCLHASFITGGCLLTENDTPVIGDGGMPVWRVLVFSPDDVEILDTWHTTGLAGSGSNDYRVRDLFVPEEHCFDVFSTPERAEPLYAYHGLFFANVPGVPLGLARRALDEACALAQQKRVMPSFKALAESERVQALVAEASGHLRSARAYCHDVMGEVWDQLQRGDSLDLRMRAEVGLMLIHVAQSAQRVVDLSCEVAGSTALYRESPLERLRRDMIAVKSHVVHQTKTYSSVGKVVLGLDPGPTIF